MIFKLLLLLALLLPLRAADPPQKNLPLPGEVFTVQGRTAFVMLPEAKPRGKAIPWVWYAPTLNGLPGKEERWMFEHFLKAGIAIAGIDVGESYGSPDGRALFTALYDQLTGQRGFARKTILLARSRGGLMTLCWAAENPDKIAAFAGIYPVCNLTSYPGLDKAAGAYHLTEAELAARLADHNPIDRLAPLAKAGVPLFAIHGDSDKIVPLEANSGEIQKRYEALGGRMQLIIPPGQGHNMWPGFFQSRELVDFVMAAAAPAKSNAFFAMDTIARGKPESVVPLLRELGYDGLGGKAGDAAMATALKAGGLKFFNGYLTKSFQAGTPALDEPLRRMIDAMQDHGAALWLAVDKVLDHGTAFPKSASAADPIVVFQLREIAAYAETRGVRIALYPHASHWLERVADAVRIADQIDQPSVGVTFNLCHWLKVEGAQADPAPALRAALPRLMFITINGADTGDTVSMGWDRLIQPLDQGTYDTAGFVRLVRAIGYTGPVGFQGYGIKDDPRAVLQRSIAWWRGL